MTIYNDLEQGSEEWHAIRWGKVGGASADGFATDGKYETLLNRLVACRLEPYQPIEDYYESPAMQRGSELEPLARLETSKYTGIEFNEVGWIQSDEVPLIGISPDGISPCGKFAIEIKCPGRDKHTSTLIKGTVPSDNLYQCVHYFSVIDTLDLLYFVSFRPESEVPLKVIELRRETKIKYGQGYKTIGDMASKNRNTAIYMQQKIKEIVEKIKF